MAQVVHGAGTTGWPGGLDGSAIHNGYLPKPEVLPASANEMNVYKIGIRPKVRRRFAITISAQALTWPGASPSVTSRSSMIPSVSRRPRARISAAKNDTVAALLTDGWPNR